MSPRLIGFIIVSLLAFAGCSGHYLRPVQPFEASLEPYDGVCFSVGPGDKEDFLDEVMEIEEQVVMGLYNLALFDTTYMGQCYDSTRSILNVTAVITDIRNLNFFQRHFHMFASPCVAADLYFVDAGTGDTVGVYYIIGNCDGSADNSGILKLSRGIVKLIRANCSRMGRGHSEKPS